ncbi:DUF4386 family protein [Pseudoalteromonas sp. H105]|jgi:hypothetical protein|uniref:DUF4386 family protein n=1 Tax=Pseudoalteromonas sp. H105 TaxID=1348393 RepID=UPI000731F0FD|nr:DUF4386 family protein [Pseudoalteromonas sp. H105]KTF10042.1 hypothetical protein ATS75_19470 [Pseudoalteromonas sp. H105]
MKVNLSTFRARLFGGCFIMTFLSYGIGSALVNQFLGDNVKFEDLVAGRYELLVAIVLISVVHTIANVALPIIMYRYLASFNPLLTKAYLVLAVSATLVLAASGYPIYALWLTLDNTNQPTEFMQLQQAAAVVFNQLYSLSMLIWAVAGICFARLLGISALLPNYLSTTGVVFYSVFASHSFLGIMQVSTPFILIVPGALFEITLSAYLLCVYRVKTTTQGLQNPLLNEGKHH